MMTASVQNLAASLAFWQIERVITDRVCCCTLQSVHALYKFLYANAM